MTVEMASVSITTDRRNLCEKTTEKNECVLQKQRARKHRGRKSEWEKLDVKISFRESVETTNDSSGRRKRNFNSKKISAEHNRAKNSTMRYKSSKERNHLSKYEKSRKGRAAKGRQKIFSADHNSLELTKIQLKILTGRAVEQVEYFLSDAELCRNTYLRHNMDICGYLPLAIILNFPSVAQFGIPYAELIEALKTSKHVEIDQINETIRVKENYEKWLYPNPEGGFGCSRWIKVTDQDDCLRMPDIVPCTDSDSSSGYNALEESISGLSINL